MDYIRTKEAVGNCGITDRMVMYNSFAVRIKGTKKVEIHGLFLMTLKNRQMDLLFF